MARMNRAQRVIVIATAVLLVAVNLYPPWNFTQGNGPIVMSDTSPARTVYGPLFHPPELPRMIPHLALPILAVEWLTVLIIASALYVYCMRT